MWFESSTVSRSQKMEVLQASHLRPDCVSCFLFICPWVNSVETLRPRSPCLDQWAASQCHASVEPVEPSVPLFDRETSFFKDWSWERHFHHRHRLAKDGWHDMTFRNPTPSMLVEVHIQDILPSFLGCGSRGGNVSSISGEPMITITNPPSCNSAECTYYCSL